MLSFYPGPSQLHSEIPAYLQDAATSGILTANHRSKPFMSMMQSTVEKVKEKLGIPNNYQVYFCSAATECWEIIAQSYASLPSLHVYNGAFGEKWWLSRKRLHPHAVGQAFSPQQMLGYQQLSFPFERGLLCLTHNETSNGTQVRNRLIGKLKKRFPQALVCVDATSSMAGVELDWQSGDIWYASVQKCFGMPSGLAVMVCSPKALQWAEELDFREHYNSLLRIREHADQWQTTHTPNVLGIYLLGRVMQDAPPIRSISNHIKQRGKYVRKSLREKGLELLIQQERLQSDTVIAVKYPEKQLPQLKDRLLRAGYLLGNGYGSLKHSTFRLANFPAIPDKGFEEVIRAVGE